MHGANSAEERVDSLRKLRILDSDPETNYDDITKLVAAILEVPIALVSLLDTDRQWFKSHFGLDARETPIEMAFCAHAIQGESVFEIPNASEDDRFRNNPLVTGDPQIRFYAGIPIASPDGHRIGTLCAIDRVPRRLTPVQSEALRSLGRQVETLFCLRRKIYEAEFELTERRRAEDSLRESQDRFRAFMDQGPAMAFIKDGAGRLVYVNKPLCEAFQIREEQWLGRTNDELFPAEVAAALTETDRRILRTGLLEKVLEYAPTPDRDQTHWQSYKFPLRDRCGQLFLAGMAIDVTAERRVEAALKQSEELFRNVVEQLAEGVVLLDRTSRKILRANRAFLELLNYEEGELGGLTQYDFVAHTADDIDEKMARIEERGRLGLGYRKYRRKDGSIFDVTVGGSYLVLDGRACLCLVVQDMTDVKSAENALLKSREKYFAVVEHLAEGVFLIDNATGLIGESNTAFQVMLGYSDRELRGLTARDVFTGRSDEHRLETQFAAEESLEKHGRYFLGLRKFRRKDGAVVDVEVQLGHIPDGGAGLTSFIIRDVTERLRYEALVAGYRDELERKNAKLQRLATTDALTELNNRMAMNERLDSEFRRAVRYEHPFSIILLDIDHFKSFNDTFGHPAGDEVLKSVAELIRSSIRDLDFAARYGGEEFAILLPDTDRFGAIATAERCRAAIADHGWKKRKITISVGISSLTPTTSSEAEMVKEADQALYQSKHLGRNRVNHGSNVVEMHSAKRI